jgi:hypothetical protein
MAEATVTELGAGGSVFADPVATPFSNFPVDGASATLHDVVPTQLTLVVPLA